MIRKIHSKTLIFTVMAFTFAFCESAGASGKSKRGWLGVSISEMTPSMKKEYEMGNRSGLLITQVVEDSPADDAGLREDDVIFSYDGNRVELSDEFSTNVRKTAPGTTVRLKVLRDGNEKGFEVTIARRKKRNSWFGGFADGEHNLAFVLERPRLGVQVHELNEDLAPYFKVETGALITEVSEDSPAERAGLKAGDVITVLDEEPISGPDDLIELLADYEDGDEVTLEYLRLGKKSTVEVELEGNNVSDFRFHTNFAPRVHMEKLKRHEIHRTPKVEIREFKHKDSI